MSYPAGLLVTSANYRCYAAKVGGYKHQVALEWVKDGYADDTEGDGRTRMKRRKGEIGFTLSTRKISTDNQMNRVKDKFHVDSMKN